MFKLITKTPVALDSPDHLEPWGAKNDNHSNKKFNEKLYKLLNKNCLNNLTRFIMDLGCAGGAFVKDCIDDGHYAIGLEGSDYPLKNKLGEWGSVPNNLFTCDVSKPFRIFFNENIVYFDVITAWELIEHIKEENLHSFFVNVWGHLKDDGYFIMTVASHKDGNYHQTVQQPGWWYERFRDFGWKINDSLVEYFYSDWVRRPEPPSKIVDGKLVGGNGFHVVLQK